MTMQDVGKQSLQFQFLAGATDLFGIAKRSSDVVAKTESITQKELRDTNLVAIVFSALAVEAFLNELAILDWTSSNEPSLVALDPRLKVLQRFLQLAEESNLQSPGKLLLAHEILGVQLETGQQPFQDYHLLKQLRDSIVHSKPTSVEMRREPIEFHSSRKKLLRALQSRGLLSYAPAQRSRPFLDWLDSTNLARWATEAASGIIIKTIEALPEGGFKDAVALLYRDFYLSETNIR